MSKFSIDTDKVSSVASEVSNLSTSSSSVASSVSSYETQNEDGFDFAGAKGAIENNVDGMKVKVSNTSVLLDAVVGTHNGLQQSVSEGNSTGGNANSYGSYSYSGGYTSSGGSSGGSSVSGVSGYGSAGAAASLGSKGKAILGLEEIDVESGLNSLMVADPLAEGIESALKDNPSAYEKLLEELGKVKSDIGTAESTLNEELEVALSSNDIKKTDADGLVSESFGKTLLVVEASTKTSGIVQYIKDVSEVAKEHNLEVRFLELDKIIEYEASGNFGENKIEDTLVIKNEEVKELEEQIKTENTTTEDAEKITTIEPSETVASTSSDLMTPTPAPTPEEVENAASEENSSEESVEESQKLDGQDQEETQEKIINEDEKENKEEQKSEEESKTEEVVKTEEEKNTDQEEPIITSNNAKGLKEEVEEDKQEEKEKTTSEVVDNSRIKDKAQYDKLMNIPTVSGVENDIFNSPVTMLMKNNLITDSMTGVVSKEQIEAFIKRSGIDIDNISSSVK